MQRIGAGVALQLLLSSCGSEPLDRGDVQVIDVGTSSAMEGWAVNYPKQRKVFFMAGRLWLFYADGSRMLARSTTDGATLSDPIVVREEAVFGHRCGFAFDGAFLHSACCLALPGADVFYRRGVPGEGAIAWEEERVAFDVPDAQSVLYPKVVVDAAERPWVAFMLFEGGFETAPQRAMVIRSNRTDGVWQTDDGFPFALSGPSTETFPDPLGVSLESGAMFWIWDPDGESHYVGRSFVDATGWSEEERISEGEHEHGLFDAVADGDRIHVSYGGGRVHYRQRSADGAWGRERDVTGSGHGHTSIATLGDGRALVTWLDAREHRVLQREMSDGELGPTTLVLDAGDDELAGRLGINLNGMSAAVPQFRSAIAATLGSAPPYRVVLATVAGR